MAIVQLDRITPAAIYGILLATYQDAITLWEWAHGNPDFVCRLYDKTDGSWELQIEGPSIATAVAAEGQWIVLDGNEFKTLSQAQFDNLYTIHTP